MVDALRGQGWSIPEQQANFIWLRLGPRSAEFAELCDAEGLTVRPFADEGVRVTVAEPEANERFIAIAQRWRSDHTAAGS